MLDDQVSSVGGNGALISEEEITLPKATSVSCEYAAQDTDYVLSALQRNTGARFVAQREAEEEGREDVGWREEWKPAGVHVGETSTAIPAPHPSDGGVKRPRTGVEVVDESELRKGSVSKAKNAVVSDASTRYVRLPSARERRTARSEGRVHAFGVRGPTERYVCLQKDNVTHEKGEGYDVKLFDAWTTLARNIRDASKWATETLTSAKQDSTHGCGREGSERAHQKHLQWDSKAPSFVPSCCAKATSARSARRASNAVSLVDQVTTQDDVRRLQLRELLKHKQVSHVRYASPEVRAKMDAFNTCSMARCKWICVGQLRSRSKRICERN